MFAAWDNVWLQSVILSCDSHVAFVCFSPLILGQWLSLPGRPTYLICIFWSCVPAVQTVRVYESVCVALMSVKGFSSSFRG